MNYDKILEYKFKAKLGNIYDGSNVRTVECKAKSFSEAIDTFTDNLYKSVGDTILSIEIVGYVIPITATKEIPFDAKSV